MEEYTTGNIHLDIIIIGYINRTIFFREELLQVTSILKDKLPSIGSQKMRNYRICKMRNLMRDNKPVNEVWWKYEVERMKNPWVEHVLRYAKRYKITYGQAMIRAGRTYYARSIIQ